MSEELFKADRRAGVIEQAERLFAKLAPELSGLCPGAEVHHVGGTSVPGVPTKGDLDVQIRVPRDEFAGARKRLEARFAVNHGGFQLPDGISFEDKSTRPEAGIHLTALSGECDVQWVFSAMLNEDAALRERYAAIKRAFEGKPMAKYRDAKADFFEELFATPRFAAIRDGR